VPDDNMIPFVLFLRKNIYSASGTQLLSLQNLPNLINNIEINLA